MIEPSFQSYYHKIINNLNSNKIFYKYFDQEKKYKDAYQLLKKIIIFIKIKSDSNTRKNIYVSCDKSFLPYCINKGII